MLLCGQTTRNCSVTAFPQLLLGLCLPWQELLQFCWKVPVIPFVSGELSLPFKGPDPQTIYVSKSNWFLSQLPEYLCISGPKSVVMQEVYSKQRSENTTQAKAVTICAILHFIGIFWGQENLLWITAVFCFCILTFDFKIKTRSSAVNYAYWLACHKLESSFQLALPWLKANTAIDHLINWKKIKGTVICVSALLLSSWQSACFCLEQRSVPWPCSLETLV